MYLLKKKNHVIIFVSLQSLTVFCWQVDAIIFVSLQSLTLCCWYADVIIFVSLQSVNVIALLEGSHTLYAHVIKYLVWQNVKVLILTTKMPTQTQNMSIYWHYACAIQKLTNKWIHLICSIFRSVLAIKTYTCTVCTSGYVLFNTISMCTTANTLALWRNSIPK